MMDYREQFKTFVKRTGPFSYERQILNQHWDRIRKIIEGGTVIPYEVEIEPTNRCNLSCIHCIGAAHKPAGEVKIPPERMFEIVNQLADRGTERIKFSGFYGEPLMNKEATLAGMRQAIKRKMKVGLFTNGALVDNDVIDVLMGAEYVNFSLDAGTGYTYKAIKGTDQLEKVLNNLKAVSAERTKRGSTLEITVSYIITSKSAHEIPTIAQKVYGYADVLRFKIDILENKMTKAEMDHAYNLIEDTRKLFSPPLKIVEIHDRHEAGSDRRPDFQRCYFQHLMGAVGCDGNFYPCDHKTYPGGEKAGFIPAEDCKICPPMGYRVNCFIEFLEEVYKKDPAFLDWVEAWTRNGR